MSLALSGNWVREGGYEKGEVTAVEGTWPRTFAGTWGTAGGQGSSPVNASLEFWNPGEPQTHWRAR